MSRSKYYDKTSSQWVHSDKSGLPANVFPTFDDLRVNLNEKSLQVKANTGKQLKDCELKEIVYLFETVNSMKSAIPYLVVEKNDDNVVLLRQKVGTTMTITTQYYPNSNLDTACTSFLNRFSTDTLTYTTTKDIKIIASISFTNNVFSGSIITSSRKVFLPSCYELMGTTPIFAHYRNGTEDNTTVIDGDKTWFNSDEERKTLLESGATETYCNYWTRSAHGRWTAPNGHDDYYNYIKTNGTRDRGYLGLGSTYFRPAIVFVPETPLDADNRLVDSIVYDSTLEMVRSGGKLYDLKDLDARDSITTLETAVAGKAAASHTHVVSDITDFPTIPTAGTITSGSTGYATGGDVYNAINKPLYDLAFLADADSLIDSRTSGATVTNAHLTALVSLDDLLLKSDRYDRVELCGGFHYTDPNLGFLIVVPATLSYNAIIPNQVAQQMLPTIDPDATINSKDAFLVRITPIYNDDAYQASFVIWEDENDVRQVAYAGT